MRVKQVVSGWDYKMILLFNSWSQNRKFCFFMQTLTRLGGATCTTATVLLLIWLGNQEWTLAGYTAALALSISTVISQIIKRNIKRFRPYLAFTEIQLIGKPEIDHSFPSGHTTAIFSIMTAFSMFFPAYSIPFFLLAILVGFSRVFLGKHYPTDVVAGMTLGILISIGSHAAVLRYLGHFSG